MKRETAIIIAVECGGVAVLLIIIGLLIAATIHGNLYAPIGGAMCAYAACKILDDAVRVWLDERERR